MYEGFCGTKTLDTLLWGQQYALNNYNFLQCHYNSPTQAIIPYNQQCCNMADTMNKLQSQQTMNSLQSQMEKNPYIKTEYKEEIRGNEMKNNTIKDYMNKEFLYESELKEIEDKFHFKFDDLELSNINEKDKIYQSAKEIIDKLKTSEEKYVSKIEVYEYGCPLKNSVYVYFNKSNCWDVKIDSCCVTNSNKDRVMDICNVLLIQNNPEYQQFYEKYKNRIVKDNQYEDLSFYEKILQE